MKRWTMIVLPVFSYYPFHSHWRLNAYGTWYAASFWRGSNSERETACASSDEWRFEASVWTCQSWIRQPCTYNSCFPERLNAALMRTTGSVHSVMGGSFDSSKGEFRLCGVTAGVGGQSYMNYLKVPAKVDELCALLQEKQKTVGTLREQYELSFNAHLNLVTIHPWVDGNGRTARLLMNYIQFCYHLFPTKIFKEDREAYILSLRQCQAEETNQPFLDFMAEQLKKSLSLEIERFNASQKKGFCFMFWYYIKIR